MTTTTTRAGAVARHAARLRETIRFAQSRASRQRDDEYARNVAKACLSSERSKAIEHVVVLTVDAARRGDLGAAEAIGLHLQAIARCEHAAVHGEGPQLSVQEAQLLEEEAEGEVERAEMAMAQNPTSLSHALVYLTAASKHERARRDLNAAVRRQIAESRST
jgi:hypothetical protein